MNDGILVEVLQILHELNLNEMAIKMLKYCVILTQKSDCTAYRSKFCVWRDPQSLCRLLTGLWMYQLRM